MRCKEKEIKNKNEYSSIQKKRTNSLITYGCFYPINKVTMKINLVYMNKMK